MSKSISLVLKPIGRSETKSSLKTVPHITHNTIFRQRFDFAE